MVSFDQQKLRDICRAHGITRLALFGSTLRGEDGPESDVDLLVEFEPSRQVGYFGLARAAADLEALIGRRVDLRTAAELSRYFRDDVLHAAQPLFVAA